MHSRSKAFKIIGGFIILLLLIAIAFQFTPITPIGAIRFYVATHGYPLAAFRVATIHQGGYFKHSKYTNAHGWQFFVDGLTIQGNHICFWYLDRNFLGIWTVISAGTGP